MNKYLLFLMLFVVASIPSGNALSPGQETNYFEELLNAYDNNESLPMTTILPTKKSHVYSGKCFSPDDKITDEIIIIALIEPEAPRCTDPGSFFDENSQSYCPLSLPQYLNADNFQYDFDKTTGTYYRNFYNRLETRIKLIEHKNKKYLLRIWYISPMGSEKKTKLICYFRPQDITDEYFGF